MVKNKFGGNKHKKFARKRDESGKNSLINLKKTEGQEYGYIQKILGNCRFQIICYDKKQRIGHVRGKLRKRMWFNAGDLILISLRDFQDDMCDMIQKYDYDEVNMLINNNEIKEAFGKNGTFFDNKNDINETNISFVETTNEINDSDLDSEEDFQDNTNSNNSNNYKKNQVNQDEIDITDIMNL